MTPEEKYEHILLIYLNSYIFWDICLNAFLQADRKNPTKANGSHWTG